MFDALSSHRSSCQNHPPASGGSISPSGFKNRASAGFQPSVFIPPSTTPFRQVQEPRQCWVSTRRKQTTAYAVIPALAGSSLAAVLAPFLCNFKREIYLPTSPNFLPPVSRICVPI